MVEFDPTKWGKNNNSEESTENSTDSSYNAYNSEIKSNREFRKNITNIVSNIDDNLEKLLNEGKSRSQSSSRNSSDGDDSKVKRKDKQKKRYKNPIEEFTDNFIDELFPDIRNQLKSSKKNAAKMLGVEVEDLYSAVSGNLGKDLVSKMKSAKLGKFDFGKHVRKGVDATNEWISNMQKAAQSSIEETYQRQKAEGKDTTWYTNLKQKNVRTSQDNEDIFGEKSKKDAASNVVNGGGSSSSSSEILNSIYEVLLSIYEQEYGSKNLSKLQEKINGEETEKQKASSSQSSILGDNDSEDSSLLQEGFEDLKEGGKSKVSDIASKITGDGEGSAASKAGDFIKGKMPGGGENAGFSAMKSAFKSVKSEGLKGFPNVAKGNIVTAAATAYIEWATSSITKSINEIRESLKKLGTAFENAAFSEEEMRKERDMNAKKRTEADFKTYIEYPFKLLEQAADELCKAWDSSIRTINQTQGYTKENLQDLISNYAQRLREEGLDSVVSSADITNNLKSVLEGGLSGKIAEEFAYQATKLNAAVPTQNWFEYSATYASIAANAMQAGKSQSEAIADANKQLEQFASNLLYSSRQLTGGFTTGLNNASDLLDKSVKIARAAKTGDSTQISGTLTSISAILGAVAPDLASSIVDLVYEAATGGNSSNLVALRSLAGINASNTEFLRQFAKDPQSVFETIFKNLGQMQNMSPDAYMEVAEGLSSIFGLSMDALSQIDFNYLANNIAKMQVNTASLDENMSLLASGESTTTAEQQRMQQINQYMIDEGLAYVLDNEIARSIQQHMWEEQIANDLKQSTFGVELVGSTKELFTSILNLVTKIVKFLTFAWLFDAGDAVSDYNTTKVNTKEILEAGKVGQGNSKDLYKLVTTGEQLYPNYNAWTRSLFIKNADASSTTMPLQMGLQTSGAAGGSLVGGPLNDSSLGLYSVNTSASIHDITSQYSWGSVGKSFAEKIFGSGIASGSKLSSNESASESANDAMNKAMQSRLDRMTATMDKFIEDGKSYEDWAATASKFGISNLSNVLDQLGKDEKDLKEQFSSKSVDQAAEKEQQRKRTEEDFWANMQAYTLQFIALVRDDTNKLLTDIYNQNKEWYTNWVDYWIKHKQYSSAYDHSEVLAVQLKEKSKSEDAVYALAEALTKNTVDLLDPTVQTNALLSQILIVVNAIMNQNNKLTENSGSSLTDTLSALAMGLTNRT